MARPVRKGPDRWPSRKHASGYARPFGPIAWMVYGQQKKSTALRWKIEVSPDLTAEQARKARQAHKDHVLGMLDRWIDSLKADPESSRLFTTVYREYYDEYIDTRSDGEAQMCTYAFDAYFPDTEEVKALRFRPKDLRRYLIARHKVLAGQFKRDTLRAYRARISRLFKSFAIPREYIDTDPTAVLEKGVGLESKSTVDVWTREEVLQIVAHAPTPRLGLRWMWQYLTGMRPSEVARMRWEDYRDGGLTIYGAAKGKPKPGDIERDELMLRPRAFVVRSPRETDSPPVATWMQAMIDTLEEARSLDEGDGYIWGREAVEESSQLRSVRFKRAVERAGIDARGRRQYDLRASAGDVMDLELGFDDQLIADLSGHDRTMRMDRYRRKRTTDHLDRRISDRTPGSGTGSGSGSGSDRLS